MKFIKIRGLASIKKIKLESIRGGVEEFDCKEYCNTYQVIIHTEFEETLPDVLRKHV
jgi:hypothetical protein